MNLEQYKLLKNKKIAEVLDGDETFDNFELSNSDSFLVFLINKMSIPSY